MDIVTLIVFFTLIISCFIILFISIKKYKYDWKMLLFLFFIIAFVFWSFLHESFVGASKYKMRLKLLDNYSYYKIERESSSDAISDIQFTVLDRGGKEKEYYLSLENNLYH